MRNTIFEEDRLLTKAAETPRENKPRFDWAEDLGENRFEIPKVRITDGAGDRDFHIAEPNHGSLLLWGRGTPMWDSKG
jgi:hypothetical protein